MLRYFAIFTLAFSLHAETIYFANVLQGTDSGSTSNNAHGVSWLAIATNYANPKVSGKYGPGDTLRLVGIITNSVNLGSASAAGTMGNLITLIADDTNSKLSAPSLIPNTRWINIEGCSFIKIDGLTMELTDNGTGMSYSNAMTAIFGAGTGCSDIILTNNHIDPLFTRTSISNAPPACVATYIIGSRVYYLSNYVNMVHTAFNHSYTPSVIDTVVFYGNTATNFNHGIECGAGQSVNPIMLNLTISHNTLDGGDAYESPNGVELGLHRDPIFLFNQSGLGGFNGGIYTGYISNYTICNNFIRMGQTPQSTTAGTAAMYIETLFKTAYIHGRVFNNISTLVEPLSWSGGGGYIGGSVDDILIVNNSALGWGTTSPYANSGQISIVGTNAYLYNNACVSGLGVSVGNLVPASWTTNNCATAQAALSGLYSDYNLFNRQGGSSFVFSLFYNNTGVGWANGIYNSLAEWTNACSGGLYSHFDPHSRTNIVSIGSGYSLGSAANFGTNLTSLGIAELNSDFYGNPRPASGNWIVGAVQTFSSSPIVINPPLNFSGAINLRTQ